MHNHQQRLAASCAAVAPADPAGSFSLRNDNGVPLISLSIEDASAATGISRTKLYEWIKGARLTARKADGRTLIEAAELYRIVRELPAIGRQPDTANAIDVLTTTTVARTELRRRITEILRNEFAEEWWQDVVDRTPPDP